MATVPHHHPTVETVDATLGTRGPTDRPCVRVAADAPPASDGTLAVGDTCRVVLDGSVFHGHFVDGRDGPELRGVFDTPDEAREPGAGTNHLVAWVDDRGLAPGRTVHVDAIDAGHRLGLRGPGESATYEDPGGPDESLAAIAAELSEE